MRTAGVQGDDGRAAARAVALAAVVACGCACGVGVETVDLDLAVPFSWQQQSSCPVANFQAPNDLGVTLTFSGNYAACTDVEVDPDALTVLAHCPGIATDIVRYLSLEYRLTDAGSRTAELVAVLATVDLRPSATGDQSSLMLDLTHPTPPSALVIATPAAVASLPSTDDVCEALTPDSAERDLCLAERWWLGQRATAPADFDRDDDGTSNIDEACAGSLFQ